MKREKEQPITINDIADYLDGVGLQYLATIGLDGKPKVRPVQYMVVNDKKLYFCTNSQKAMYAELQKSPFIELCGSRLQEDEITTAWIRFSAEVIFPEDDSNADKEKIREIKEAIMQKSDIVRELYKNTIENPIFKIFYLKNICGSLANLGHVKGLEEKKDFALPVEFDL